MHASLQQGALASSQAHGYKVGDLTFYMGQSQTFADGDKVVHGQQGEVIGVLPTQLISSLPTHVAVRFSGNKGYVGLRFTEISRHPPPPLHGGYRVGEKLFYTWPSRTFEHNGTTYKLVQAQQGEVMGPGTGQHEPKGTGLAMLFPGNKGCVDCVLAKVSRIPPPPALHSAAGSQEEVTVVGERSFAQRDAECRKRAIDLDTETPRKRGRAVAAALEERVVGARSVCTAAVDKRVRELTMPAIEQWNAGQIDGAELDRRRDQAQHKAMAEHASLTALDCASFDYREAVSARTKAEAALSAAEAAEDAAEAQLEELLRALERGQPPGSSQA